MSFLRSRHIVLTYTMRRIETVATCQGATLGKTWRNILTGLYTAQSESLTLADTHGGYTHLFIFTHWTYFMASKVSSTMTVKKANCVKVKSSSDIKRVELQKDGLRVEREGKRTEQGVRNRCCRSLLVPSPRSNLRHWWWHGLNTLKRAMGSGH